MNETPQKSNKTKIGIILITILLLCVLAGLQLFRTNPERTMNAFLTAIENGDQEAAMELVSDGIKTERRENIAWYVDDWVNADTVSVEVTNDEAWRQRYKTEKDANNQEVIVKNQYGDRDREVVPTARYVAGLYHANVTVNYDENEDPVIITLRRKGDNQWSKFSTTFRGWEIVRIQYQPSAEIVIEGKEVEEGAQDEFYEFDGTDDVEFDVDKEGNIILPEKNKVVPAEDAKKSQPTKASPKPKKQE